MDFLTFNDLKTTRFVIGQTALRTPKYKDSMFFHMPDTDRRTSTGLLYLANCDVLIASLDTNTQHKFRKNSLVLLPENSKYYSEFTNIEDGSPTIFILNTRLENFKKETIIVEKDPYLIFEDTPKDVSDHIKSMALKMENYPLFMSETYLLFDMILNKITPETNEEKNINRIISYMNSSSKSNKELAAQFNMSVSTLTRMFKKYYKTTPASYALQLKIADAKYRLVYSNISISQISSLLGFNSPEHFSRIFKKHTGLSPTKYRHSNIAKK